LRVAIISTYPPRPCGIAVFASDLRSAMVASEPAAVVDVVSIVRERDGKHPPEVVATIRQDVFSDYVSAAQRLTSHAYDVVLLEHEYGIFGGDVGNFVVTLAQELTQPLVVTLHTVLSEPSREQAATLAALCKRATLVTVFTETARRMVTEAAVAAADQVRVIPHGAPDLLVEAARQLAGTGDGEGGVLTELVTPSSRETLLSLERLSGTTILSTFGLISASKGLEVAVKALPAIVARHPEARYLIAGQTHPDVVSREGESYRLRLERLVRDLGMTEQVLFLDKFLTIEELVLLLSRTDLYITPYRSREQIVSGALTFAVAAGCAVVSTPYLYAEDLLTSGAGVLVPFGDADALAAAVVGFLDSPTALQAARTEARRVGEALTWRSVSKATMAVLAEAVHTSTAPGTAPLPIASSPQIRPAHLLAMTDDVGIIQHARGVLPDRATGYCVDDAARLAIVAMGMKNAFSDPFYDRILALALAFLYHAWAPQTPGMHNFMGYDRRWLDSPHRGDHVGRTAWALGEVIASHHERPDGDVCLRLLTDMAPCLQGARSIREVAFAVLGLCRPAPEVLPSSLRNLLPLLAGRLADHYEQHSRDGWRWFEDILSYDNARLPQALVAAAGRLGDKRLLTAGLDALDWYAYQCQVDADAVRLVGNRWRRASHQPLLGSEGGDEQPLDAAALVEALAEAATVTGRRSYGKLAVRAFEWFLGRNTAGVAVYDFATGGCHDGLGPNGLNENEGAESTLAFLQAVLSLEGAGLQSFVPRQR
jgi:glycosyltransferase involved in cell wall biosynthesis